MRNTHLEWKRTADELRELTDGYSVTVADIIAGKTFDYSTIRPAIIEKRWVPSYCQPS